MDTPTSTLPFQQADTSKLTIIRNGDAPVEETKVEPKVENTIPVTTDTTTPPVTTPVDNTTTDTPKEGAEGDASTNPDDAPGDYTDDEFYQDVDALIADASEGSIKSLNDLPAIIAENKKLKADLANKELTFPNPAAKVIYDIATQAVGAELSTARQLLHVHSLNLETMTPKEKQFEAFRLDRPNVSEDEARKRFEAMYEKSYSDLENDLVQVDSHEMATRSAETKLKEHRKALDEAVKQGGKPEPEGPTPEQIQAIDTQLESSLSEFGGISLKFDDSQYGKLDIPMDKGKAKEFMEVLKNPNLLINQIADRARDEQGNLKVPDFIREMYLLFDRDRIAQEERDHLIKLGRITQIQEQKNTPKKDLREETTTPVKSSFKDAMVGAVKAAGMS